MPWDRDANLVAEIDALPEDEKQSLSVVVSMLRANPAAADDGKHGFTDTIRKFFDLLRQDARRRAGLR